MRFHRGMLLSFRPRVAGISPALFCPRKAGLIPFYLPEEKSVPDPADGRALPPGRGKAQDAPPLPPPGRERRARRGAKGSDKTAATAVTRVGNASPPQ